MAAPPSSEPYQSLYRRYRPQRFADVLGQDHVTRALCNSVRDGRVAHAYLLSGPRGTGKTTTARVLAMALNCESPLEGEPDGTCASCVEIRRGASLDVQELDAASNRRLEEMRELIARVALSTRGRWKVYIIDEVHQLTGDAASALLKTLEEPPGHVVFVLATTDPQRVLPTIRSRTQHFEFRLLSTGVLGALLRDVNERAALGVPSEAIDLVVRRGHGSARDALSVLDQVAAAGGVDDEATVVSHLLDAVADRDPARVLVAVGEAVTAGRDPRRLGTDLLEHLRNGFLATQARGLVLLSDDAVTEVEEQARRLGLPALVRAMELVGQALTDMRDAIDPRITLEVALVRLAAPEVDDSRGALLERVERLERTIGSARRPPPGATEPAEAASSSEPLHLARSEPRRAVPPTREPSSGVAPAPPLPGRRPGPSPAPASPTEQADQPNRSGRAALGAHRRPAGSPPAAPPDPVPTATPAEGTPAEAPATAPAPAPGPGDLPSRDQLTTAWGDAILPALRPAVKAYLASGRFVAVTGGAAVYALPDHGLLQRAEPLRPEVEAVLADHFGRPVPLHLVLDDGAGPAAPAHPGRGPDPGTLRTGTDLPGTDLPGTDLDGLEDAGPAVVSAEQRLLEAFPGAEEVFP